MGGYSVELVALDDANLAGDAAQRAREMIIDPAIMAVLGGFDGAAAQSAAAEYAAAGMPFVTLSSSDAAEHRSPPDGNGQRGGAARRAASPRRHLGARRLVMLSEAAAGADPLGDAFADAAQAGGAAVSRIPIDRWQLDFSNVITGVQAAAPDLVFFAGRAAEAGELLKQMARRRRQRRLPGRAGRRRRAPVADCRAGCPTSLLRLAGLPAVAGGGLRPEGEA